MMIIEHVCRAFLNQSENNDRNQKADAMRQELSETCPVVIWHDHGSVAYNFIQSLCQAAKWNSPNPMFAFLDAVDKANRSVCNRAGAR